MDRIAVPLDSKHKKLALEIAEARIRHHNEHMTDAQEHFREVIKDQRVFLVNNTFNFVVDVLHRGLKKLREAGFPEMADLYEAELFQHHLPKRSLDIFKNYVGINTKFLELDITKKYTTAFTDASCVFFSGSSAHVSYGVERPEEYVEVDEVRNEAGVTHGHVLTNAMRLYEDAAAHNLPVVGMCYGHQMITHHQGGKVIREGEQTMKLGMERIAFTQRGRDVLTTLLPAIELPQKGIIAAYHEEATVLNSKKSLGIMEATDRNEHIMHASIHIADGEFSESTEKNLSILHGIFDEGRHFAFTLQGHPEYTALSPIILYGYTNNFNDFLVDHGKMITSETLHMISGLLEKHKSFR